MWIAHGATSRDGHGETPSVTQTSPATSAQWATVAPSASCCGLNPSDAYWHPPGPSSIWVPPPRWESARVYFPAAIQILAPRRRIPRCLGVRTLFGEGELGKVPGPRDTSAPTLLTSSTRPRACSPRSGGRPRNERSTISPPATNLPPDLTAHAHPPSLAKLIACAAATTASSSARRPNPSPRSPDWSSGSASSTAQSAVSPRPVRSPAPRPARRKGQVRASRQTEPVGPPDQLRTVELAGPPINSPTEPLAPARSSSAASTSHLTRRTRRPHARPGHHFNIAACTLPISLQPAVGWCCGTCPTSTACEPEHAGKRACAPLRPGGTEDLHAPAGGGAGVSSTLSRKPPNSQPPQWWRGSEAQGAGGPNPSEDDCVARVPGQRQRSVSGPGWGGVRAVAVLQQQLFPLPLGSPAAGCAPTRVFNHVHEESRRLPSVVGNKPYRVCERVT